MTVIEVLRELHSGLRWFIVVLGLFQFYRLGRGTLARGTINFDRRMRLSTAVFRWLFRIQVLVGLLFFVVDLGNMTSARWEHAGLMLLALAALEFQSARFPGKTAGQRYRHNLLALIVATVLLVVNIIRVPAGWNLF